jgi:hypothetical protein
MVAGFGVSGMHDPVVSECYTQYTLIPHQLNSEKQNQFAQLKQQIEEKIGGELCHQFYCLSIECGNVQLATQYNQVLLDRNVGLAHISHIETLQKTVTEKTVENVNLKKQIQNSLDNNIRAIDAENALKTAKDSLEKANKKIEKCRNSKLSWRRAAAMNEDSKNLYQMTTVVLVLGWFVWYWFGK